MLVYDHVTGPQEPQVVLRLQGTMGEVGIAGTKDDVGLEIDPQLFPHRLLDVDGRQHPEALGLERGGGAGDRLFNWHRQIRAKAVSM